MQETLKYVLSTYNSTAEGRRKTFQMLYAQNLYLTFARIMTQLKIGFSHNLNDSHIEKKMKLCHCTFRQPYMLKKHILKINKIYI